jgi:hypothetical protein
MRYKINRSPRLDRDELCVPPQVSLFTIGYVMDNTIGNSGGLGGVFGILYAVRPGSLRESLRHCGRRSFSRLHARYLISRALARFLTCATGLIHRWATVCRFRRRSRGRCRRSTSFSTRWAASAASFRSDMAYWSKSPVCVWGQHV